MKKTHKFSARSEKQLNTCHVDLQKIFYLAIKRSNVDFGISEGHRPVSVQKSYYAIGRTTQMHREPITNIDGVNKLGKHNKTPSMATDIYVWKSDKRVKEKITYDKMHLSYVAGVIDSCAKELLEHGEISHGIRWGGNWDSDGIIAYDHSFDDLPHFELVPL